jgi:hypothetical protein
MELALIFKRTLSSQTTYTQPALIPLFFIFQEGNKGKEKENPIATKG